MRTLLIVSIVLSSIGAINWGLVGAFEFNLVDHLFGDMSAASRIIYCLVGIAGIFQLVTLKDKLNNEIKANKTI